MSARPKYASENVKKVLKMGQTRYSRHRRGRVHWIYRIRKWQGWGLRGLSCPPQGQFKDNKIVALGWSWGGLASLHFLQSV